MPDNTREKPILFSAPMVRAILAGRKTMTRRILKPQPYYDEQGLLWWHWSKYSGSASVHAGTISGQWVQHLRFCVGDTLWVRETWAQYPIELNPQPEDIWYKADGRTPPRNVKANRWRPSIHMPRWASRITLRVT